MNRRLIPDRNTRHNTRGQADAIFYPNSTVGGDVDSFFKFDASRVPGVSTAKHLTSHNCDRRIVIMRCEEEIGMTIVTKKRFHIGGIVLILTVAAFRKMGRFVIAGIALLLVSRIRMIFARKLIIGRLIAKDCRAFSVRYQGLTRWADRNAATIAASGIAAYIRVVYKQPACVIRVFRITLNKDAAAAPVVARHAAIVCDVDCTFFSAVTIFRAVNHRVNPLAHSDAGTFRSVAHIRGNISSLNVEPCHTSLIKIGNVNAAASFLGIVASNLAIGNGDMGAVIGSKSAAAVVTIAILAAEFSHSIIRDIATRNGHDAALGHNAATESLVECAITGDYAISYGDLGITGIHTTAAISAVAGNDAASQFKGRDAAFVVGYHNARADTRARSAANVSAAHVDGRAVLGIDEVADLAIFLLREHAAFKIKVAAIEKVDEP